MLPRLRRIFILIDAEHGVKEADLQLLRLIQTTKKPFSIIATKADKIYVPKAKNPQEIRLVNSSNQQPKSIGSFESIRKSLQEIAKAVGPVGADEVIACSTSVSINRRLMGVDGVRWAMIKAALDGKTKPDQTSKPITDVKENEAVPKRARAGQNIPVSNPTPDVKEKRAVPKRARFRPDSKSHADVKENGTVRKRAGARPKTSKGKKNSHSKKR